MKIQTIETKLKAKAKYRNAERAKRRKELKMPNDTKNSYYRAIKWTEALALNWQVRNQVFKGCNGKAVFDPIAMTATSYKWWAFVRRINGKVVFNDYHYSMTTCGHQSAVRSVMRDLGIKIDLEVQTHASLSQFETAVLPELYHNLFTLQIAAGRRNAKDRSKEIAETERKIKVAKKLGATIDDQSIMKIEQECQATETRRLQDVRRKSEEMKNKRMIDKKLIQNNKVVDLSQLAA